MNASRFGRARPQNRGNVLIYGRSFELSQFWKSWKFLAISHHSRQISNFSVIVSYRQIFSDRFFTGLNDLIGQSLLAGAWLRGWLLVQCCHDLDALSQFLRYSSSKEARPSALLLEPPLLAGTSSMLLVSNFPLILPRSKSTRITQTPPRQ